jgi:Tol biopolymer transport system component
MRGSFWAVARLLALVAVALAAVGCGVTIETGKSCFASYTIGLSPNGRTMAVTVPDPKLDHLFLLQLDDGASRRIGTADCDSYPSWSPNGKEIAVIHDDSEIAVVNLYGARRIVSGSFLARNNPHWTPDQTLVYGIEDKNGVVGDMSYAIGQIPAGGGKAMRPIHNARFPSLANDRRSIAYVSNNLHDLYTAPYPKGTPTRHISHSDREIWNVAWSPDKRWIALTTTRYSVLSKPRGGIHVVATDGSGTNIPVSDKPGQSAWTRDSRYLYFVLDKKLYVTDLHSRHRRLIKDLSTLPASETQQP